MKFTRSVAATLAKSACLIAFATPAAAQAATFKIPAGDMKTALDAFVQQSGIEIFYRIDQLGIARSSGLNGTMSVDKALQVLLSGSWPVSEKVFHVES